MMWFLMLFNGFLASLGTQLVAGVMGYNNEYLVTISFFVGAGISFLIAKVMVSKGGDKILGFIAPARKMSQREQERVKHILARVQEQASAKEGWKIKDIRLYTMDSPLLNAFAMGRDILGLTSGALEHLSDDELAGLIAHELGHFHYKDSERQAVNFGLLCFAEAMLWVNGIVLALRHTLTPNKDGKSPAGVLALFILPLLVLSIMFKFVGSIGIWVYNFTYPLFNHKQEFRADMFACKIGFGAGLASVLSKIMSYEEPAKGLTARLTQTHPDTGDRIAKIDDYLHAA